MPKTIPFKSGEKPLLFLEPRNFMSTATWSNTNQYADKLIAQGYKVVIDARIDPLHPKLVLHIKAPSQGDLFGKRK